MTVGSGGGVSDTTLTQIRSKTTFTGSYNLTGRDNSFFFVEFRRQMFAEEVFRWDSVRNTGIRLSWSYDRSGSDDLKVETNFSI